MTIKPEAGLNEQRCVINQYLRCWHKIGGKIDSLPDLFGRKVTSKCRNCTVFNRGRGFTFVIENQKHSPQKILKWKLKTHR